MGLARRAPKRPQRWGLFWKGDSDPGCRPLFLFPVFEHQPSAELAIESIQDDIRGDARLWSQLSGGTIYPVRLDLFFFAGGEAPRDRVIEHKIVGVLRQQWALLWVHPPTNTVRPSLFSVGFRDSAEAALSRAEEMMREDTAFAEKAAGGAFFPVWMNLALKVSRMTGKVIEAGANVA